MDPPLLLNSVVKEECCAEDDARTLSNKMECTKAEEEEEMTMMMTKDQISTGSDEHDVKEVTNKEITHTSNGQSRYSKVGSKEKNPATNLPLEVLQLIFKNLSFHDLYNVQNVCTRWNLATSDVLVWKNTPLKLDNEEDLEKLNNVPYLHTVTGHIDNKEKLFDSLMNNVIDLRKIDCTILEYDSVERFQIFLDKFKNLEFICLKSCFSNFIALLEVVSLYPSITSLCLHLSHEDICTVDFVNVCRIMDSGFLALKKLYLKLDLHSENRLDLLKIKLDQLTDLRLHYDPDCDDSETLEFIFKNSKLENLEIFFGSLFTVSVLSILLFDLSNMTGLKFLAIEHDYPLYNVYYNYKSLVFPQNIEHLKLRFCSFVYNYIGVIRKVIDTVPSLRVLDVSHICDSDLDQQLENVNNLPYLHTVSINNCNDFSILGVETILKKCAVLRKLEVSDVTFRDETYECLKECKYLGDVKFERCPLDPYKLMTTISAMIYLTRVCMNYCRGIKGGIIREETVNNIIKECNIPKPYAKIYCESFC